MNVTMRIKIGGYRNGEEWPDAGGTIDVPDHEADSLIANGYATATPVVDAPVDDVDPPTPSRKSKKKGKDDAATPESADEPAGDEPVDPAADEPHDGTVDDPFEGL